MLITPINVVDSFSSDLKFLEISNSVVEKLAPIHPYAQAAWTVLSSVSKIIIDQANRDNDVGSLLTKMNEVYTFLTQAGLRDIKAIKAAYVNKHWNVPILFKSMRRIPNFERIFFPMPTSVCELTIPPLIRSCSSSVIDHRHTRHVGGCTSDDVKNQAVDFDLNSMPYVSGAGLDTGEILDEITTWINSIGLFWLHGSAGTGKSSIAHSAADRFKRLERLGSCYCFDRNGMGQQRDKRIFATIAQDLADRDKHMRSALADVISLDASLKITTDIVQQWKEMVLTPAQKPSEGMVSPIVIIIDGLDESGGPESRNRLLHILAGKVGKGIDEGSHITQLTPNIRILLTSRPLPNIENALWSMSNRSQRIAFRRWNLSCNFLLRNMKAVL